MIVGAHDTAHLGTMGAAVDRVAGLNAVADDTAIAMSAFGRERVDRAFEAVECVGVALDDDVERFVVIVSANLAACHGISPRLSGQDICPLS
jgi:hypothetical protein